MIDLPNFDEAFLYENNFYLSCGVSRLGKLIAHYELFKQTLDVPGAVVECGVFKGASFSRFAMFRELLGGQHAKKLIGFDIFGKFPETQHQDDLAVRSKFISEAGEVGIAPDQLLEILRRKGIDKNVELIAGDVTHTIPKYVQQHPELRISLLNLDTDIYEPAVTILEHYYPRLEAGGILMLDDYGVFPGETKATVEYFLGKNVRIRKLPHSQTPSYIIKE